MQHMPLVQQGSKYLNEVFTVSRLDERILPQAGPSIHLDPVLANELIKVVSSLLKYVIGAIYGTKVQYYIHCTLETADWALNALPVPLANQS